MWHSRKGIYNFRVLFQNAVSPKAGIPDESRLRHCSSEDLQTNDCNTLCHGLNVSVSPKLICWSPNAQFAGFSRYLGRASVMGVGPPQWDWCPDEGMKGSEPCLSSPHEHAARRLPSSTRKVPPHGAWRAGTLASDSQPPEPGEIKCCLSHPVCGLLLQQPNRPRYAVNTTKREVDKIPWVSRKERFCQIEEDSGRKWQEHHMLTTRRISKQSISDKKNGGPKECNTLHLTDTQSDKDESRAQIIKWFR